MLSFLFLNVVAPVAVVAVVVVIIIKNKAKSEIPKIVSPNTKSVMCDRYVR